MVWFTVQAKTTLVEHIPTTINEDPTDLFIVQFSIRATQLSALYLTLSPQKTALFLTVWGKLQRFQDVELCGMASENRRGVQIWNSPT